MFVSLSVKYLCRVYMKYKYLIPNQRNGNQVLKKNRELKQKIQNKKRHIQAELTNRASK